MQIRANSLLLVAGVVLAVTGVTSVYLDMIGNSGLIIPISQIGFVIVGLIAIVGIILWKKDNR